MTSMLFRECTPSIFESSWLTTVSPTPVSPRCEPRCLHTYTQKVHRDETRIYAIGACSELSARPCLGELSRLFDHRFTESISSKMMMCSSDSSPLSSNSLRADQTIRKVAHWLAAQSRASVHRKKLGDSPLGVGE